jgi:transmembrane sensor
MNTNEPGKLLDKYNAGLCSPEEQAIVENWYLQLGGSDINGLDASSVERTSNEVWTSLTANKQINSGQSVITLKYWSVAAALFLIAVTAILSNRMQIQTKQQSAQFVKKQDIPPGSNKAFLTLGNGEKYSLTDAANGRIAKANGLLITKAADGQLIYTVSAEGNAASSTEFNKIETPRRGQYQINLPDGTKVWLNAASSLRYPIRFADGKRRVELVGEGYFEVAKNKQHPFVVKTAGQEVEVLGTHFNINSYDEEPGVNTTLLEGSVRVTASGKNRVLLPGEQSQVKGAEMEVSRVDTEAVLSWKNGDFVFTGDNFKSIMRKISRWYDVEVIYQGNFDDLKFGGYISRSKNISAVLSIMESTGKVHFTIKNQTITVSR